MLLQNTVGLIREADIGVSGSRCDYISPMSTQRPGVLFTGGDTIEEEGGVGG